MRYTVEWKYTGSTFYEVEADTVEEAIRKASMGESIEEEEGEISNGEYIARRVGMREYLHGKHYETP